MAVLLLLCCLVLILPALTASADEKIHCGGLTNGKESFGKVISDAKDKFEKICLGKKNAKSLPAKLAAARSNPALKACREHIQSDTLANELDLSSYQAKVNQMCAKAKESIKSTQTFCNQYVAEEKEVSQKIANKGNNGKRSHDDLKDLQQEAAKSAIVANAVKDSKSLKQAKQDAADLKQQTKTQKKFKTKVVKPIQLATDAAKIHLKKYWPKMMRFRQGSKQYNKLWKYNEPNLRAKENCPVAAQQMSALSENIDNDLKEFIDASEKLNSSILAIDESITNKAKDFPAYQAKIEKLNENLASGNGATSSGTRGESSDRAAGKSNETSALINEAVKNLTDTISQKQPKEIDESASKDVAQGEAQQRPPETAEALKAIKKEQNTIFESPSEKAAKGADPSKDEKEGAHKKARLNIDKQYTEKTTATENGSSTPGKYDSAQEMYQAFNDSGNSSAAAKQEVAELKNYLDNRSSETVKVSTATETPNNDLESAAKPTPIDAAKEEPESFEEKIVAPAPKLVERTSYSRAEASEASTEKQRDLNIPTKKVPTITYGRNGRPNTEAEQANTPAKTVASTEPKETQTLAGDHNPLSTNEEASPKAASPTTAEQAIKTEENEGPPLPPHLNQTEKARAIAEHNAARAKLLGYTESDAYGKAMSKAAFDKYGRDRRLNGRCYAGVKQQLMAANIEKGKYPDASTSKRNPNAMYTKSYGYVDKTLYLAKEAGPYLKSKGYKEIGIKVPENAPTGAIVVYKNPRDSGHAGHIEIVARQENRYGKTSTMYCSDACMPRPATRWSGRGSEPSSNREVIAIYYPSDEMLKQEGYLP